MKKVLIIIGSLIVLFLLAAVLVPVIFKDDIKQAIDDQLDNSLNAKAYYDPDDFGLSLFNNFPNLTVSIGDFGIAGVEKFEGDTLIDVESFLITIDIMSVISGDQIKIKNVKLDRPVIQVLVLEDGSANYDIAKPTESETEEEPTAESTSPSPVNIAIDNWEINEADLVYYDQTLPFYITLFDLNHSGSGDFSMDVFDMSTTTKISELSLGYDNVEYITNKTLEADIVMAMDLSNGKFTFKENSVSLNAFQMGFDGFISMPDQDIEMDITYAGKDISLEGIISLIPGLYQEYLDGVEAGGTVGFDGYIRGLVSENSMPKVAANLSVDDGRIVYSEYPIPMEDITIKATFDYPSADLRETSFNVESFSMNLDGEQLMASLNFKDLEDYYWNFKMDGNLDLEKVLNVIPIEDMTLKGKINAKLQTEGRMSDLEAEQYQKIATSGSMRISDFLYESSDLPQGFGIANTEASFNPSEIVLASFKGNAGNTDLNMTGRISNYMGFALEGSDLLGKLNFNSSLVDINEWMVPSDTVEEEEVVDTTVMEVIRIPTNIDFVLTSRIDEMLYDNLSIKDFLGAVIIRDGAITMNGVQFDLLDGTIVMNGSYETAGEGDPTYSYDLDIKELSIASAFRSFSAVQKLAPFVEKVNGKFTTNFNISGALDERMLPRFETISGGGLLQIAQASLADVKLLSAVSSVSSLNSKDGNVSLRDVLLQTEIKNGRVIVQPFEMTMGGYNTSIAGSHTIDGKLDYIMTVKDVSTGAAGQALNQALSSLTGGKDVVSSQVDINYGVGGDWTRPTVKLLGFNKAGAQAEPSTKTIVKTAAQEKVDEQKEVAEQKVEEKKEEVKAAVNTAVDEQKEEAKKEIDKAKEKAEDALKGLLGKKKKKKKGGGK